MTYDNASETTEYGPCPYIAHYNTTITTVAADVFYIHLPKNVSLLNEFMCGSFNREGTLCGKCKDGYGTALYTHTLWNAVSVGDLAMDGSCAISWNFYQ